jgi:hypothetical protein
MPRVVRRFFGFSQSLEQQVEELPTNTSIDIILLIYLLCVERNVTPINVHMR